MSFLNFKSLIVPALALLPVASGALGAPITGDNWPIDPDHPLAIADRGGEETQAKWMPLADGGFYVSWFDNTDGGYDLRLQRLDGDGNEMWGHGGILVVDRTYNSTTDYGLSIDTAGNALLSLQCCTQNAADERIVVFKVDGTGAQVWGSTGIAVSTVGEGELLSFVTGTTDGNVAVAWMNSNAALRAQKLDATGAPLWGSTGITLPGPATGFKFLADIKPGLNGDAIVDWSNQAGSTRILRAQKLASADGAVLWGNDGIQVSDTGNLQAGYFPKIIVDGQGGAVFAYYDAVGSARMIRVQHLDASGNRLLGNDGALATTEGTRLHVIPSASFDASSGITSVAWVDNITLSGGQTFDGLYAQRIDSTGARLFVDSGLEIVPMSESTDGVKALSQVVTLPAPDGFLVGWVTGSPAAQSNLISVMRIDGAANFVWNQPVFLKTSATKTSRLSGETSELGYAAFVWSDAPTNDNTGKDVLARNLQYNGEFGDILFRDGFDD
ncbi:hypothetical protein [Dokdonella sp.]|uniref:hypothetical protein n=1 Tax=Dokdonella sp. TaxID=2291710 RepID=UPI00378475E4